jgi:SAM-dependent methyltransferase
MWPLVRGFLPAAPARIVEVGCGSLGGFVPMLRSTGYDAICVDPHAPDDAGYQRIEFESAGPFAEVDAVVASTSLHHVADPAQVLDRVVQALADGGRLIVVEWDREAFDKPTAEWCFGRLASGDEPGWLHRLREDWAASGELWTDFIRAWADEEGIHRAATMIGLLDDRFAREYLARGPYFFPDLAGTTEEDEHAAIEAGRIRPTRVDYVGTLR